MQLDFLQQSIEKVIQLSKRWNTGCCWQIAVSPSRTFKITTHLKSQIVETKMIKEFCREQLCKGIEIWCRPCFLKTNTIVFHILVSLQQQHWIFANRQPMFVLQLCWMSWKSPKSFLLCFFWVCFQLTFISNKEKLNYRKCRAFPPLFLVTTQLFSIVKILLHSTISSFPTVFYL